MHIHPILDPLLDAPEQTAELIGLVREVSDKELRPGCEGWERTSTFPRTAFAALGRAGLLGLPYPASLGGGDQSTPSYLAAIEEMSAACMAVGLGVSVQVLTMFPTVRYGTTEQQQRWLPPAMEGEWIGSYCLSEPGSGSDAAAMRTRASIGKDSIVVSGTKAWVTHGGESAYYVVFCRSGGEGAGGVSCVFVPSDTPGVQTAKVESKMGLKASPTAQVAFEDAEVPLDHLIGEPGEGFRIAMAALDGGRLGIASCGVGVSREACSFAVSYAKERQQFGRPIIENQGIGFMLADMASQIVSSRAAIRQAAEARDASSRNASALAAIAKLTATDTAMRVTTDAVQVLGGYGYVEEFPVERLMREAKVLQIVEGTNQIQRVVISRALQR